MAVPEEHFCIFGLDLAPNPLQAHPEQEQVHKINQLRGTPDPSKPQRVTHSLIPLVWFDAHAMNVVREPRKGAIISHSADPLLLHA